MFGLVIVRGQGTYAAVARRKRDFKAWQKAVDAATSQVSANESAWRMRDESGWIAGSDNAHKLIQDFPTKAAVFW